MIKAQTTTPALGHVTVTDKAVAATCTATGKTEGSHCSRCGTVIKAQTTTPALGHSAVTDKAVAATCTTTGKTEGSHCSRCGTVIKVQTTVAALGHTAVTDNAVAATCTTTGKTEGSHCSRCGTVIKAQTTTPALGHAAVTDNAVAATCTATGKTEGSHCSRCGTVIKAQTTTPALGHAAVTDNAVAATCTATGKTEGSHCSRCGTVIKAQTTVAALGHAAVTDEAVAATCTTAGKTEGSHCSRCKEIIEKQEIVPAFGHNFNSNNICIVCGAENLETTLTLIYTAEDLLEFANNVNSGLHNCCAVLMEDIYLYSIDNWTPIGSGPDNYYSGEFDGNYHTIRGLKINSNQKNTGLFGYAKSANIMNIEIDHANVICTNTNVGIILGTGYETTISDCICDSSYVEGVNYTGGICGYLKDGKLEYCANFAEVLGTGITNDDICVAGVVGGASGCITSYCFNEGKISGYSYVGGVTGNNYNGNLICCFNTGEINGSIYTGGVTGGKFYGEIVSCFNTGAVKSHNNNNGGIVGYGRDFKLSNCYNIGDVYSGYEIIKSGSANVVSTGCYYLKDINNTRTIGENKSESDFESGNVCNLLNSGISDELLKYEQQDEALIPYFSYYPIIAKYQGYTSTYCGSQLQYSLSPLPFTEKNPHIKSVISGYSATCESFGFTDGIYCSVCGECLQRQDTIPASGHMIIVDPYVEPTCDTPGKTEGLHCQKCNTIFKEQESISVGHNIVIDKYEAPTCTKPGKTQGSHCSICNEIILAQEEIPATGHKIVIDYGIAASSGEPGRTEGSHCAICDTILVAQTVIPALPYDNEDDDPTEEEEKVNNVIMAIGDFIGSSYTLPPNVKYDYYIYSSEDLYGFADAVKGNTSLNAILMSDIYLYESLWEPIEYYSGIFNGNNHIISGLRIESVFDAGVFGFTRNATIINLGINESRVLVSEADMSNLCAGMLVGTAYNTTIDNCFSAGNVYGTSVYGGLVGNARYSTISNSYNGADVQSSESYNWWWYGFFGSSMYDSEGGDDMIIFDDTPKHVGGLCGEVYRSDIINCYNYGSYIGNNADDTPSYVGGIAGNSDYSTFRKCYNNASIEAQGIAGGLIGQSSQSNYFNCFNKGDVRGEEYACGIIGSSYNDAICESYNIGGLYGSLTAGIAYGSVKCIKNSYSYNDSPITYNISNSGQISNCYYLGTPSGDSYGEIAKEQLDFENGTVRDLLNLGIDQGNTHYIQSYKYALPYFAYSPMFIGRSGLGLVDVTFSYDASGNRIEKTIVLKKINNLKKQLIFNKDKDEESYEEPYEEDFLYDSKIKIYPNPTKGALRVDIDGLELLPHDRIEIFDSNGKEVYTTNNISSSNNLGLHHLQNGMYIMRITAGGKESIWKIVKE